MEAKADNYRMPNNSIQLKNSTSKTPASDIFKHSYNAYLQENLAYAGLFQEIPNIILIVGIDCDKARNWLLETHQKDIKNYYFYQKYFSKNRKSTIEESYCILYDDLMVYFDKDSSRIKFLFNKTDRLKVEAIIDTCRSFVKRKVKNNPEISLLVNTHTGIETRSLEINKPKLNIEDNYNDDFKEMHKIILRRLSKQNDKGIVLLHGKPGTGKTSYIRYLMCLLKKNIIFLPPNMASSITNPNLISILIDNPNSIFVIEDAENIVIAREQNVNSPVSTLLNISDGLLADCLNIQIICSFNTDISKIDSALTRKGRLIAKYEFKELETKKAQQLSDKLGFQTIITQPLSLTAIYNQGEKDFIETKKRHPIGFQSALNNHVVGA